MHIDNKKKFQKKYGSTVITIVSGVTFYSHIDYTQSYQYLSFNVQVTSVNVTITTSMQGNLVT